MAQKKAILLMILQYKNVMELLFNNYTHMRFET